MLLKGKKSVGKEKVRESRMREEEEEEENYQKLERKENRINCQIKVNTWFRRGVFIFIAS